MATIQLPTEFKGFLSSLNSKGVEYLVVGGFAVALHGHPRTTAALDIWIATSPENVLRVRNTLAEFGFPEDQVAVAPLHLPDRVIRMGHPPLRIQLLTSISGAQFESCYGRRDRRIVEGVEITFISRLDLLANKRAAGRAQDLADIEELQ